MRLITDVHSHGANIYWQTVCEGAHENYSGDNPCAFNIAMAFVETDRFLTERVGSDTSKWRWGSLHVNDYSNLPWSKTPLKPLFHREVPVPGNDQTPNVSKISIRKNANETVMRSNASANFKMLVQVAKDSKDEVGFFAIDTGMNGHPFSGNYFDMN